jgi:hypothetical protein
MGLWVPRGAAEFGWSVSNIDAVRPASAMGATITPAQNAKTGAYAEVLSAAILSEDCFGLLINFNNNFVTATNRNTICDIGVDPAGGTAYSILIPDLLASDASTLNAASGQFYYFPIWIRAGSSVAVRASVAAATVGTLRCYMRVFGRPRDPRMAKVGTYVTAYGVVAASSQGTAVTSGTTSEGAWTSLGTISRRAWWWQLGMGISDASITANGIYHADLSVGDASNKRIVIADQPYTIPASTEQIATPGCTENCGYEVNSGNVYGRLQCSGTADSGLSMVAYGLGG